MNIFVGVTHPPGTGFLPSSSNNLLPIVALITVVAVVVVSVFLLRKVGRKNPKMGNITNTLTATLIGLGVIVCLLIPVFGKAAEAAKATQANEVALVTWAQARYGINLTAKESHELLTKYTTEYNNAGRKITLDVVNQNGADYLFSGLYELPTKTN